MFAREDGKLRQVVESLRVVVVKSTWGMECLQGLMVNSDWVVECLWLGILKFRLENGILAGADVNSD